MQGSNTIQTHSGFRRLFSAVLGKKDTQEQVAWFRNSDVGSAEDYFRTAQASAKQQQQRPLVLRQGGQHDLGVLGGVSNATDSAWHFTLHDAELGINMMSISSSLRLAGEKLKC